MTLNQKAYFAIEFRPNFIQETEDNTEALRVDGRIRLKWSSMKEGIRVLAELMWLRIGLS
jgi:hypothetical protein